MSAVIADSAKQHTITLLVENEAGTINRLVSLFRRRGFSIACFNAGDCEQPHLSRLTLVVNGSDADLRACVRQLDKVIDVIEVEEVQPHERVSRETAMIKIKAGSAQEAAVQAVINPYAGTIVHRSSAGSVVEATADPLDIEKLIGELQQFTILEIVRTGAIAIKVSDLS